MEMWYNKEQPKEYEKKVQKAIELIQELDELESSAREWVDTIRWHAEEENIPKISEPTHYLLMEINEISEKWKELMLLTLLAIRQSGTPKNCALD